MAEAIALIAAHKPEDAVALIDERGETTWRKLDERVNRLIDAFRTAGLPTGDTLAVMSGNRREYYELLSAGGHAGWTQVPVNWHWTADELAYVLDNSDARAVAVEAPYLDVARAALAKLGADGPPIRVVIDAKTATRDFVDYEELLASGEPAEPPEQSLAGPMFYTSGTTGRPKGVRSNVTPPGTPPSALQFMAEAFGQQLGAPGNGVTLLCGPLYHSAQWAFSIFPMLLGGTVVIRHRFVPEEVLELIDTYEVTNVHLVPTQFVRLLRVDEERRRAFSGASLQVVWHGAAPCPPDAKRRMIEWWGPKIVEYYGGTEGAILSTITSEEWLEHPDSVGKPWPTVEVMVMQEDGTEAAPGEPGTLYVRNLLGIDFEYHKDADKTAGAHLEAGVFTLGDVGYLDDDGYLHLSDRRIDMIISGGVNIYPAEIEGVLAAHPKVRDVAVFGIPDDEFGEQVKAAVALEDAHEPSDALAAELVAFCREHLAGYKVPRSIDFHDDLPRQPTGKLYKRLLRDEYWRGTGRNI
jgi:long-chain acyl-CoA synthetase